MNTRATYLLLAALLVLAAVALFVIGPGSADRAPARAALLPDLKAADVTAIRATGPSLALVLMRGGGGWTLGEAKEPADGAAVDALLATLSGAREGAVVSTNPAKQGAYETDAGKGIAVRLEGAGGKLLAAFVVGAGGPDLASCYLRREGSAQVLLVSPDLRPQIARPAESWRAPVKP